MDMQLNGRTALVTGASRGIGTGAAKALAAEGCRLAICARRELLLLELADEIEAQGYERPVIIAEDLVPKNASAKVRDKVFDALGSCDILVNSAGGSRPVAWDIGDAAWVEGMTLNFETVRRITEVFVPKMIENKYGHIVNISGSSEPRGVNIATTAKAAVHVWSKGMSIAHGRAGLTFNCIAPGRVNTEQTRDNLHPDPEERDAFADENIPLGYFGEPEDIGNLIAFLASPRARFITGEVIQFDGGMRRFAF